MILPIYKLRLNPHYVFHWACHIVGIYLVKSSYGYFLRFPNSIHLHYSFVQDPIKQLTMFIAYLFSEIQSCTQQNSHLGRCNCSVCSLYLQPANADTPTKVQAAFAMIMQKYLQYLKSIGHRYTDPFFLHDDFGITNKITEDILYPTTVPTYELRL